MSRASERRAALKQAHAAAVEGVGGGEAVIVRGVGPESISDRVAFGVRASDYAAAQALQFKDIEAEHFGTPEEPMPTKIQYTSVRFHKTIPRLDAGKGQATQDTTDFQSKNGIVIELDVTTSMVTISKGTACVNVPREGVERFGPTLTQAATHEAALRAVAAETAAKNAAAQAEAEVLAAAPAQ